MSTEPELPSEQDPQDQILEAAAAVIVREGMSGASLRQVAKEAEVSLGLLSYHFDDKETLLTEAFKRATDILLQRSLQARDEVAAADQKARVRAYVRGAFHPDFLKSEYLKLRICLWAEARTNPEFAQVERDLYMRYADNLGQTIGAALPGLDQVEIDQRVTDVIVVQNGLWLNWARHGDRDALEHGLSLCEFLALNGR